MQSRNAACLDKMCLSDVATGPDLPQWMQFFSTVALVLGGTLLAAGIICFFAWNWAAIPAFVKFALIGGFMLVMAALGWFLGPDTRAGCMALFLCALTPGPLLAVFGQTYQSDAQLWELCRGWVPLAFLLAVVGRQASLWLLAWILCSAWAECYVLTLPGSVRFAYVPYMAGGQALCIALWELAAKRLGGKDGWGWLTAFWVPRFMAVIYGAFLTLWVLFVICRSGVNESIGVTLYFAVLAAGWWWYRYKRPDLFMLCLGLFSLYVTALVYCINRLDILSVNVDSFITAGIVAAVLCLALVTIIRRVLRAFTTLRIPEFSIAAAIEQAGKVSSPDQTLPDSNTDVTTAQSLAEPWYARLVPAVGAWLSAVLLFVGLGLLMWGVVDPENIFGIGCALLLAALLVYRRATPFCEQFALILGLVGTACGGWFFVRHGIVGYRINPVDLAHTFLALSLWLAVAYVVLPQRAFRCLVACGMLFSFAIGSKLLLDDTGWFQQRWYIAGFIPVLILYCLALVYGRLRAWHVPMLRPLLHALYISLPLTFVALLSKRLGFFGYLPMITTYMAFSAGVGLALAAWLLSNRAALRPRLVLVCAAGFVTVAVWYPPVLPVALPAVLPVALLGLILARHRASRAELGFTAVWLGAYLLLYYYSLQTSLLYKSLSLGGAGLVLLAAAFCLERLNKRAALVAGPSFLSRFRWFPEVSLRPVLPLVICLIFLAGTGLAAYKNEQILREGQLVNLELTPMDPRAPFLGDYMQLRYKLAHEVSVALSQSGASKHTAIVLRLDAHNNATFARLDDGRPLSDGEQRLRLRRSARGVMTAGPNAYYFQEGTASIYEQNARYGQLRVSADGTPLIVSLLDRFLKPVGTAPARTSERMP